MASIAIYSMFLQIHIGFFKIVLMYINEQREINLLYHHQKLTTTNMFLFSIIFLFMKIIPFCKNLLVHDINEINMDILKGLEIYREFKSLHFEILVNQTLCDP